MGNPSGFCLYDYYFINGWTDHGAGERATATCTGNGGVQGRNCSLNAGLDAVE